MATALRDQKALIRDVRNYLAGQVVGITRDESLLDELLKIAFCHRALQDLSGLGAEETAREYRNVFARIKEEHSVLFAAGDELLLGPNHIAHLHELLSEIDFEDPDRDIVGDIYEAFIGPIYRGQEGQFFTPANAIRALVEMVEPMPDDIVIDPACGAGGFLLGAALAARRAAGEVPALHGIDKDAYLARLAGMHLALQFGENFPIVCTDSLVWDHETVAAVGLPTPGSFSVVLTNPPFGSKIVALAGDSRSSYDLAYKWVRRGTAFEKTEEFVKNAPPQLLFLERCLRLLRPGGRLGIVLPESTLSNVSHRHMVQFLFAHATPEAVIGMPEALFKTSGKGGTHTKVCLLVARKKAPRADDEIFMAEVKWCGHDSRGRTIGRDEIPEMLTRFRNFREGSRETSRLGFVVPVNEVRDLVLAPRFYDPEPRAKIQALRKTHNALRIGDLVDDGVVQITTGHEVGKLAYGAGTIPFVRTSDISNWEIKVDPKHLLSEDVFDQFASKQDVCEGDLLMVRDGTYLIGTCAYITEHDTRIVYQSHLYKIRVQPNDEIDRFLLLAALSSAPVKAQVKSLSFTQDIIDSLGDRVRDIVVALPKKRERRQEISAIVQRVISDRVEARELARRAAVEIVSP